MPKTVDRKYAAIRRRERGIAQTIAGGLIGTRKVSVWEVLIPIVFIFHFASIQKHRELFVGNFLYTKLLALDGARKMMRNNTARRDVLGGIDGQTRQTLAAHSAGVYSEAIRACQMKEVELLLDHFADLLRADGLIYSELVSSAYGTLGRYEAFLKQLEALEDEVYGASCETLGGKADTTFMDRVRDSARRIRATEAGMIFRGR